MQKQLIINGDDFGLTRGVNSAISECASMGLLRSTTLMANGEAFEDAVRSAKGQRNLGVGIHFVLTGIRPVSPPESIPELVAKNGRLPSSPGELLKKISAGGHILAAIRRELFAQAERVVASGIRPTHFDSHKHVHMIPAVLDLMIEIAHRFSVQWIRDPFETASSLTLLADAGPGNARHFLTQYIRAHAARFSRPFFRSRIRRSGVRTPDSFYGVAATGLMNERMLERICRLLRPGVNELMTHPGVLDADLVGCKTRLLLSREKERDLLLSERVKELFSTGNIVLSNFGEVKSE